MKKYLPYIIIGAVAIVGIAAAFVFTNISQTNQKTVQIAFDRPVCDQIPTSLVSEALGQNIINTEPLSGTTTNVCQYYLDDTNFISLRLNNLSYETQKSGQQTLGRQITTNSQISGEHFVAVQDNDLINDIVLKIDDNLFLAIDRNSGKSVSEAQIVDIAISVANYLKNGMTSENETNQNDDSATLQTDEGFIRDFFELIENDNESDAVMLMTSKNTSDDSTKQAWGVQFNAMSSVKVTSVTPQQQSAWTDNWHQYKVVLDVTMNQNSADAPIPYYGYENGQNTRYISLAKQDGAWMIDEIATGP